MGCAWQIFQDFGEFFLYCVGAKKLAEMQVNTQVKSHNNILLIYLIVL